MFPENNNEQAVAVSTLKYSPDQIRAVVIQWVEGVELKLNEAMEIPEIVSAAVDYLNKQEEIEKKKKEEEKKQRQIGAIAVVLSRARMQCKGIVPAKLPLPNKDDGTRENLGNLIIAEAFDAGRCLPSFVISWGLNGAASWRLFLIKTIKMLHSIPETDRDEEVEGLITTFQNYINDINKIGQVVYGLDPKDMRSERNLLDTIQQEITINPQFQGIKKLVEQVIAIDRRYGVEGMTY